MSVDCLAAGTFPLKQFGENLSCNSLAGLFLGSSLPNKVLSIDSCSNSVHYVWCYSLWAEIWILSTRSHDAQQHDWMHCFIVRWKLSFDFRSFWSRLLRFNDRTSRCWLIFRLKQFQSIRIKASKSEENLQLPLLKVSRNLQLPTQQIACVTRSLPIAT